MSEYEQLRETLGCIYGTEGQLELKKGKITLSDNGWKEVLSAISEAGYICVGKDVVKAFMSEEVFPPRHDKGVAPNLEGDNV